MLKKIVVVEDEPALLKALNIELLSQGYDVSSATDGAAGLKLIQKELPDIVLLDLVLPKKMGFAVLEQLKKDKRTKRIPVVILSNLDKPEDRARGLKLGAKNYFVKANIDLAAVVNKIKTILKER